jgi:hypothetical protein
MEKSQSATSQRTGSDGVNAACWMGFPMAPLYPASKRKAIPPGLARRDVGTGHDLGHLAGFGQSGTGLLSVFGTADNHPRKRRSPHSEGGLLTSGCG